MVTVGLGTLLGLDERPGELAGYGPVGADVARRIAADGTWRRLLVDPMSGAVLDVGRTRYRPPTDMAEIVRAKNPSCVMPTCSTPASRCDLDHTVPFRGSSQGRTAVDNLAPLCRTDHLFKTHGGFRIERSGRAELTVRTPTGHRYVDRPPRPPGSPDRAGGSPDPVGAAPLWVSGGYQDDDPAPPF